MFVNIYNIIPMLRPICRCHTNINMITHFKIYTDIHPKLGPTISYSLSFTLLPISYVPTLFQINSLLLWSCGGCNCPVLLLCWLLDIVSNTLLALLLLWATLLLGPQPIWAVTQIIMWSWVWLNWFECLVGVDIRILGKLIAPLCCGVPMRHNSAPWQSINYPLFRSSHHVLTRDSFLLWKSKFALSKSWPQCSSLWKVHTILPMTSWLLADNCSMHIFVFCQMDFEILYIDIIECFFPSISSPLELTHVHDSMLDFAVCRTGYFPSWVRSEWHWECPQLFSSCLNHLEKVPADFSEAMWKRL